MYVLIVSHNNQEALILISTYIPLFLEVISGEDYHVLQISD